MKSASIVVMLLATAAFVLWRMHLEEVRDVEVRAAAAAPTSVSTDAGEVFRRAFWQRPGEDDRILHAERREWAGEDGLRQWQWFIVVDASPGLLKRLRDDNVFGLRAESAPPEISHPPDWFQIPAAGVEFMGSATGNFHLILDPKGRRIHATDSGTGFRPGAPEAAVDSPAPDAGRPSVHGRLPDSMPPNPTSKPR